MEQYFSYKRQKHRLPCQYNYQPMVNGSTIWNTTFSTISIIIIIIIIITLSVIPFLQHIYNHTPETNHVYSVPTTL
jgi:hypothetical protein